MIVTASIIVILVLFRETAWSIATMWRNSTYSHGFVVLPASLYLLWSSRHRVASLHPLPNPWVLGLLAGLGFVWFIADLGAVQIVKHLTLVGMLPAIVWLVLGTQVTRRLLFPLLFLFFAVPAGEDLVPPLQNFTAFFAVKALDLLGIPVLLEGRLISTPSGLWEVTQACAGLRYLIASVTLGCLYARVVYRSRNRRIGFLVASVVVPVSANGVRAFGIILLGYLTGNRLAIGVDHVIYGGIFFTLVTFLLFAVGWRWREPRDASSEAHIDAPSGGMPSVEGWKGLRRAPFLAKAPALWSAAGVALLAVAPLAAHLVSNSTASPGPVEVLPPLVSPPWKPLGSAMGHWRPRFLEPSGELMQTYVSGSQQVHLYLAYYVGGQRGAKLASSMNVLSEGKRWIYVAEGNAAATVDFESLSVRETVLRSPEATRLVWSWYWVGGQFTDSSYRAKFLRVRTRLFGGPQGSALIAVAADYAPDRAAATKALRDFLGHTSLRSVLNRMPQ